jgi:hypothetical protein
MAPFSVNLHFSGYLRSLSLLLQGPTLNIIKAHENINLVKTELKQIRENYEVEFKDVWNRYGRKCRNRIDNATDMWKTDT